MQPHHHRRVNSLRLLLVVIIALVAASCGSAGTDGPDPSPSQVSASSVASPSPASPGSTESELPDPGHVRATSPQEVLDALSDFGFTCDWQPGPDDDPGSDESVQSCKSQNAYLWFSPTLPATGFVDAARGDAKLKGFGYVTGDHWVMVSDRATIVEMARAIGGNGGVF